MPHQPSLETYLDIATEAALVAGAILQSYWGNLELIREKGRPGDLVTEADAGAEAAVLNVIQRHFQTIKFWQKNLARRGTPTVHSYGRSILWMEPPTSHTNTLFPQLRLPY